MNQDSRKKMVMEIAEATIRITKERMGYDDATIHDIERYMEEKVNDLLNPEKPRIMVYGIYNSGKSTLVNALCMSAVAEVADRPTTDKVQSYDTPKWTLIDSPGVDAPPEHEKLADSHLQGCHVVLFVISSKGGFEGAANYKKMIQLIQKGIPFYIVLNDRGYSCPRDSSPQQRDFFASEHERELDAIKRKIILNLVLQTGTQEIADKYEVIVLNARLAWNCVNTREKEIDQTKIMLYEKSNIQELIRQIDTVLDEDGSINMLNAPIAALNMFISQQIQGVYQSNGQDDVSEKRTELEKRFGYLCQKMSRFLIDSVNRREEEIWVLIDNGNNDIESARDVIYHSILSEVKDQYAACVADFRKCEKQSLSAFNVTISDKLDFTFVIDSNIQVTDGLRAMLKNNSGMQGQTDVERRSGLLDSRTILPDGISAAFSVRGDSISKACNESCAVRPGNGIALVKILQLLSSWFSKEKKRKREYEQMRTEAEVFNRHELDRVSEALHIRQEKRRVVESIMAIMKNDLKNVLMPMLEEKKNMIIAQIDEAIQKKAQIDDENKQTISELKQLQIALLAIEN